LDDTDNIKKIISANSLSFQRKRNRFGDTLEDFTTDEINKKSNVKVIHLCDFIASVPAFEYCLIIDISSITPTTKK
jgi:hypothetical protein